MNKKMLIDVVSEKLGTTKKDAGAALDAIVEAIIETVAEGQEVSISGFGKFGVSERAEREGRNPATGESIVIPASKSPKFKAATAFKTAVNG
mgnify:CR=1 FL=1